VRQRLQARTSTRNVRIAVMIAIVLVGSSALPAHAAPGDLDTSFGGDGIASSADFGGTARGGTDMAVQPDGKILVVGSRGRTVDSNMAVWRFTADGAPDTTFSGDGIAVVDFGASEEGEELALLSDDRIVVVGTHHDFATDRDRMALALLTPNGKLDPSFSGDGRVLRGGEVETLGYAVAVDPSDAIVVAGPRGPALAYTLFRYTSSGVVDRSFGGTGAVGVDQLSANAFSNFPEAVDVAVQPDGRIVALGIHFRMPEIGNPDCGVARLTVDGQMDATFSGDGFASAGFPPDTLCEGIAVSPVNAKIAVAGSTGPGEAVLARFTSNGALDVNFDLDGRVIATFGSPEARAFGVAFEGTKTIAVGGAEVGGDPRWFVARFTGRGQPDTTFGGDGHVFTNLAPCCQLESATAISVAGNRILVGGKLATSGGLAVARYVAGDA
jgi:uncharacterized delta-60 repeat protein